MSNMSKMSKIATTCLSIVVIIVTISLPGTAMAAFPLIPSPNSAREKSLVNQLVELKSKSIHLKKTLGELNKSLDLIDAKIKKTQTSLTETEFELTEQTDSFNNRIASIYKEGSNLGPAHILLGAESISDMITRVDFFNLIVRHDADMVSEIRDKRESLVKLKESFLTDRQKIVIIKEEKERSFANYTHVKERLKKEMAIATNEDRQRVKQIMGDVGKIEKFLSSRNSPLASSSQEFVLAGKNYGISPKLIIAISGIESSFGVKLCGPYNAWGRKAKGGGYKSYNSWKEAIWDQAFYLKTRYIDRGLVVVEQIAPVYCPPNYVVWANKVTHFMSII
jgi:hypothetical protein